MNIMNEQQQSSQINRGVQANVQNTFQNELFKSQMQAKK